MRCCLRSSQRTAQFAISLLCLALLATVPAMASTHKSRHKTTNASSSRSSKSAKMKRTSRKGAWKHHGQQGIQGERAREIQQALIREHYLDGEPNGEWDARTQAAMQKFQADNGWQTKVLPDSRALIKLGLGPDHSNLLNPETAAIPTAVSKPIVGQQ
jgi:peptidoglycan hydrolase-like protein with peptidoglycan-binding domain